MQHFNTPACCAFFAVLGQRAQIASIASNSASMKEIIAAYSIPGSGALEENVPDQIIKETCASVLTHALVFCNEAELRESANMINDIVRVRFATLPVTNAELLWTLDNLRRLMISEMTRQVFICIPERFARYMLTPDQMGEEVAKCFKDAKSDITEAYSCLALERNTATVFHAMRIAEHGLRNLAKRLRVTLTHNKKPMPIEAATWDKIITAVKNKIAQAHSLPHGIRRQSQLTYYSDMADRCSYMKDLWRNEVMHTRRSYLPDEASGALQRVADFMKLLTTKP
jgi:hypothetical protein